MPENRIRYVVLALTKTEAEQLIEDLKTQNKENLATWLNNNKDRLYGNNPDKWKPFNNQKIADLINNNNYISVTHLVSTLGNNFENITRLSRSAEVYFIDMFAFYLKKYKELAKRLDVFLGQGDKGKCCFLIYYGLPKDIQEELEEEYYSTWPVVCDEYKNGSLHRIAVRVDDFKNFENYLAKLSQKKDQPHHSAQMAAGETWGNPKARPDL